MRYGSVPIVRATGGLVDTIEDGVTGFSFHDYDPGAFLNAAERAIFVYNTDKETWLAMQGEGMRSDNSWERSANGYVKLYEEAIARTK
jgi:starch synthase